MVPVGAMVDYRVESWKSASVASRDRNPAQAGMAGVRRCGVRSSGIPLRRCGFESRRAPPKKEEIVKRIICRGMLVVLLALTFLATGCNDFRKMNVIEKPDLRQEQKDQRV